MKKMMFTLLAAVASSSLFAGACEQLFNNWCVYYASSASASQFADFDPIILDADAHPNLAPLLNAGKELLGYASLGEIGSYRYYYQQVADEGILLGESPNWPGSYYVDVRSPYWKNLMINTVIPNILAQGFQGIFMDTLDVPIYLEQVNPTLYAGMIDAAADLVNCIHQAFPNVKLMMNRGFALVPQVGSSLTYLLGESVYTTYVWQTGGYQIRSQSDYDWQRNLMEQAAQQFPSLKVFSLDYWYTNDSEGIRNIYREERKNCFTPYVSTIFLNEIVPEPS